MLNWIQVQFCCFACSVITALQIIRNFGFSYNFQIFDKKYVYMESSINIWYPINPQLVRCLLGLFVATRKPEDNPCGLQKVAEKGFMMRYVSFSVLWIDSSCLAQKFISDRKDIK